MPKISVIMPFYNCEKFLDTSISSILNQTFSDFEFILVNDASTDSSDHVVHKYLFDKRIIYIKNIENKWIVYNLNQGIGYSSGEFIARMDWDDISDKTRLEKQYNFLMLHPEVSIVWTFSKIIDSEWIFQYQLTKPVSHGEIKKNILKFLTISHNTSLFRRSLYEHIWPYSDKYQYCEDQDFNYRAIFTHHIWVNIPEFLYSYRFHENSTGLHAKTIAKNLYKLRKETIKKYHIKSSFTQYFHIYAQFFFQYFLWQKYFQKMCYLYRKYCG